MKKRVAVICEFSGVVRDALRERGHDAWSYDLLPDEQGSPYHVQGDVLTQDFRGFDMGICHPPCTDLTIAGARHFRKKLQRNPDVIFNAAQFAMQLWNLPIPQLALENPIGLLSNWMKPHQIIQPRFFGEAELKATCLWLRGLPKLHPTLIIPKSECQPRVHWEAPGPERWKNRSRTLFGIAWAMATQWGDFEL
jgi:hypothetical protein